MSPEIVLGMNYYRQTMEISRIGAIMQKSLIKSVSDFQCYLSQMQEFLLVQRLGDVAEGPETKGL